MGRFGPLMEIIQWILPDLSRLDWRVWPMYGLPPAEGAILYGVLLGAGYLVVLVAVAVMVFRRREFF